MRRTADQRQNLGSILLSASIQFPERPALTDKTRTYLYSELNFLVEDLCSLLHEHISPGDLVAIFLPKGIAAIASIHAVLRAGGVYVPVDPTFPARRALDQILASDATVIISTNELIRSLQAVAETPIKSALIVTNVGALNEPTWLAIHGRRQRARILNELSNDLSHIIYTSGSTGRPKGVAHTHSSTIAFVNWALERFAFEPDDVLLSIAPFHFDLSILDLFVTSSAGGLLVLPPTIAYTLPAAMVNAVIEMGITSLYTVPTALKRMSSAANAEQIKASLLRRILYAGETFALSDLRRFRNILPDTTQVHNLYGPTETNVVTHYELQDQDFSLETDRPVPIGIACPFADILLRDGDGKLASIAPGLEGELCVGGLSVMAGYWRDPHLSLEAFVTNVTGDRFYRTGDMVRINQDGQIMFLGRHDRMVKVNGYRVELEEAERVLLMTEGVREAAVILLASEALSLSGLVAFIVGEVSTAEVKNKCRANLPQYMCPVLVFFVNEFPLTSNGKIDYLSLTEWAKQDLKIDTAKSLGNHLPTARFSADFLLRECKSTYNVNLGGALDSFNSASYVMAGTHNIQEVPLYQPDRYLRIANLGKTTISQVRIIINGRRRWHTINDLLDSLVSNDMSDSEKALALFEFMSRVDVQAHNNYLRIDDFLPDEAAGPSHNQFLERADPIKALNCYYVSGCVLSAANLVILSKAAKLQARVVMAAPFEGPHDRHAGAEIYYDSDWHFFDPEARAFFLDEDNETVASYARMHANPALVIRTHEHGFAAPTCRGAFVLDYRESFPPYEVPTEQWLSEIDLLLRPDESFTYRWDHQGKYRYGSNPRKVPDIPYRLANGLFTFAPNLTRADYRNSIVGEQNIAQVIDRGEGPKLRPLVPSHSASITWKVTSPFPIVGGRIKVRLALPGQAEASIRLCLGPPPWNEIWSGGGSHVVEADIDFDDNLGVLMSAALRSYYLQVQFSTPEDPKIVGLHSIQIDTDVQMSQTALPAMSVGPNAVSLELACYEDPLVRVTHGWDEYSDYQPPLPPLRPITPQDGSIIRIEDLKVLEWDTNSSDGNLMDHHVMVSPRPDFLHPVAPDMDRLTFKSEGRFQPSQSFWRHETNYYWRVRSRNKSGIWSDWGPAWTFTTSSAN